MKCCDVKGGDLRHRITVERSTETRDDYGGQTVAWTTRFSAWAKITPMSTSQILYARQLEHRVSHKIVIRFRDDIEIDDRISYDSRIFHVRGYKNVEERDRWLEIEAEEGAAS